MARVVASSRNLGFGREILVGSGLAVVGVGGYVSCCRFGGDSGAAPFRKGPFGKLSGFGWNIHLRWTPARERQSVRVVRPGGLSGRSGVPTGVLVSSSEETGFPGNGEPFSRERGATAGNRGVPFGIERFPRERDWPFVGPSGLVEGHLGRKAWDSGAVETLLRSSPRERVLRDSSPERGSGTPRG